jgi:aquaporin Z
MVGKFNAQSLIMETFGTFLICFFGGLVTLDNNNIISVSLVSAIIVFIVIHIGGDISGGYYNPAITFAFFISKYNNYKITLCYLVVQIIGSVLAGIILLVKIPETEGLGYPKPPLDSNLAKVFIYETSATFVLVLTMFFNIKTKKGSTISGLFSSLIVLMSILSIGPVTGGSLNPARSLGPSIIDGNFLFYGFWIYLTAPFLGGLLGAVYFEYVLRDNLQLIENSLSADFTETKGLKDSILIENDKIQCLTND